MKDVASIEYGEPQQDMRFVALTVGSFEVTVFCNDVAM
jgi:hypothetical protein